MDFPELTALARYLEGSDPRDPDVQGLILRCADELRAHLPERGHTDLAACLDAATILLGVLAGSGDDCDHAEIKDVCYRLLRGVERSLARIDRRGGSSEPPPAPTDPPQLATPPPVAPAEVELDATTAEDAPSELPQVQGMMLGQMLVELGHVTEEEVARALQLHGSAGLPIGECLLMQGAASPEVLTETMKLQNALRSGTHVRSEAAPPSERSVRETDAPPEIPAREAGIRLSETMFLGEALLGAGMITKEQLERAMHVHFHEKIRVGEALVRTGALSEEELEVGLELHRRLRHVAGLSASDAD